MVGHSTADREVHGSTPCAPNHFSGSQPRVDRTRIVFSLIHLVLINIYFITRNIELNLYNNFEDKYETDMLYLAFV